MKFTLNWLSCQKIIGINKLNKAKAKAKKYVGGINFTLISVPTVCCESARSDLSWKLVLISSESKCHFRGVIFRRVPFARKKRNSIAHKGALRGPSEK